MASQVRSSCLASEFPCPREWRVASSGFGQIAGGEPGPYGAIGGILLMRPNDSAHEFLLIHTNAMPVRDGLGQPLECMVDNILFQSVGETRNGHNGCSFVMATRVGWLARAQSSLPSVTTRGGGARDCRRGHW